MQPMPKMNMVQSLNLALDQEMAKDDNVVILGEDVDRNCPVHGTAYCKSYQPEYFEDYGARQ